MTISLQRNIALPCSITATFGVHRKDLELHFREGIELSMCGELSPYFFFSKELDHLETDSDRSLQRFETICVLETLHLVSLQHMSGGRDPGMLFHT